MKERIQKVLANAGIASRRNIEEMVLQGRVSVNGKIVRSLPVLVDPETDHVAVDGERAKLGGSKSEKRYYFLMNKPKGVYTTNVAQGAQVRAIDLLPKGLHARLYPVGRLDSESKGLLLLTNDGDLTNRLTHPRYGVPRTYRASVDGYVREETLEELGKGIWLADREGKGFKTGKSHISIAHRTRDKTVLEITLREARDNPLRRMLAAKGHKVKELTRIKMGPLTLERLAPGQCRELSQRELRQLREYTQKKPRPAREAKAETPDETP